MDAQFSDVPGVATFRRGQKRSRRTPEQELTVRLSESDPGTSGTAKNMQKRDRTSAEKESPPTAKRRRTWGRGQPEQFSEENKQRRLRSVRVSARSDVIVSAAVDKNTSNVNATLGVQHGSTCTTRYPHRKHKNLSCERHSSLDLQAASPTGRNQGRASGSSEIPISPDYVRIVQQMEDDEHYARSLQAQFDREAEDQPQYVPAEEASRILRSNASETPTLTTEQASASHSDTEVPQERPNVNRRGQPNEGRTRRRRLAVRGQSSRRPSSMQYLLVAGAAIDEIGLPFPLTGILGDMNTEVDLLFSSLQGIHENLENFHGLLNSLNVDAGLGSRGLSTAQINRLPTHSYRETGTDNRGETYQTTECQICLCAYEEGVTLRTLPCFHEFHNSCIDKWLKINRSCPVCRALINVDPSE